MVRLAASRALHSSTERVRHRVSCVRPLTFTPLHSLFFPCSPPLSLSVSACWRCCCAHHSAEFCSTSMPTHAPLNRLDALMAEAEGGREERGGPVTALRRAQRSGAGRESETSPRGERAACLLAVAVAGAVVRSSGQANDRSPHSRSWDSPPPSHTNQQRLSGQSALFGS